MKMRCQSVDRELEEQWKQKQAKDGLWLCAAHFNSFHPVTLWLLLHCSGAEAFLRAAAAAALEMTAQGVLCVS